MARNGVFSRRRRVDDEVSFSPMESHELHVLVVDYSLVDRKVVEKLLKITSCKVTVVDSGRRALQFLGLDEEKKSSDELNDKEDVQHQISVLLFIGLTCGALMLIFTRLYGPWGLRAFSGAKNTEIITAANTYIQIRGLAWPAVLIGWVAQSASLGMKDSWGPLKALVVASVINSLGDIILCRL